MVNRYTKDGIPYNYLIKDKYTLEVHKKYKILSYDFLKELYVNSKIIIINEEEFEFCNCCCNIKYKITDICPVTSIIYNQYVNKRYKLFGVYYDYLIKEFKGNLKPCTIYKTLFFNKELNKYIEVEIKLVSYSYFIFYKPHIENIQICTNKICIVPKDIYKKYK